ncbi:ribonuclease P protein subunit p40 [Plectropomus leopardus]|uniref:ribonuclease P protein subunit p40 n=1 Tax=Plectropomus leopardus TaxID=160734 RepID=UPI001C4C600D|nr:ribonuclease P protein subunit p40 [Plectropomus leopardus]
MSGGLARTPRTLLVCDRSSFLHETDRLSAHVQRQHFNYKVSVLLPECSSAPSQLDVALNSFNSFYLIRKLPVFELLDKHFLETAVYPGGVSGLSYRTRVDEDTCIALTPNGHLTLSLDKDSFELLGVEGKPSRFNHRAAIRYVVSVDLTARRWAQGGRGHQRLITGLSRLHLETDFVLTLQPGGGASLQALLSRYDWSEHRPEVSSRVLTNLSCHAPGSCDPASCDPHRLLEWLGAVDADVSCENLSSSFLSSLVCPEPKTTVSQALSISVCGLLCPQDVHHLIQQLRCYLEQSQLDSWAALTVHGFVDSPVSWGSAEHGGGHSFYSLLMSHDLTYQLYLGTDAKDTCPL